MLKHVNCSGKGCNTNKRIHTCANMMKSKGDFTLLSTQDGEYDKSTESQICCTIYLKYPWSLKYLWIWNDHNSKCFVKERCATSFPLNMNVKIYITSRKSYTSCNKPDKYSNHCICTAGISCIRIFCSHFGSTGSCKYKI